jgi:glycosyltransferase involved in cell wall biosynthesis
LNYISLALGSAILLFIICFWSARIRDIIHNSRWVPVLKSDKPTAIPENIPLISIIVPAHNEESMIKSCLESIIAQDYTDLEIICVNDRSTDRTASIVAELFEGKPNCKLISIKNRPSGWTGKCHALHEGVKYSTGDWLAFLDADSRLNSSALRQCLNEALKRKINLVTLSPKFELDTFWEKALVPTFAAMAAIIFPLAKVNNPNNPVATANGMFFIISRSAYEKIGGHCNVRDLAVEDIGIGKRVKASGLGLLFANGRNLLKTRMYSDLRQVLNGWTRILCAAMNYRITTVLRYLAMHILVSLPSFMIATYLYTPSAMELWPNLWFVLPAACGIQMTLTPCLFADQLGVPRQYSAYIILGNLMLVWIFMVMLKKIFFRDALQWRGTTYCFTRYQPKRLDPSEVELAVGSNGFESFQAINEPQTFDRTSSFS